MTNPSRVPQVWEVKPGDLLAKKPDQSNDNKNTEEESKLNSQAESTESESESGGSCVIS